jgi:hypothetical protein
MRRMVGLLMFVIGLAGAGWLAYNYFQIGGEFPTIFILVAIALILLGAILLFAGRRQEPPAGQFPTNAPPRI